MYLSLVKDILLQNKVVYVGITVAVGLLTYSVYHNKQQATPSSQIITNDEDEEEKLNSEQQSQRSGTKQSTKKTKHNKKKEISIKINQKTKKQFFTDVESENPEKHFIKLNKQQQNEKNHHQDDKLFFQIYSKITKEESNEES